MKCTVTEKKGFILAEVGWSLNKSAPFSARDILRPWRNRKEPRIVVDLGGIDEDGNVLAHLSIINAFKKETELANGYLKICSLRPRIRDYLLKNGLYRIFDVYDDLNGAENSPWEKRRYRKRERYTGAAA